VELAVSELVGRLVTMQLSVPRSADLDQIIEDLG
jgi:hypothetical protein